MGSWHDVKVCLDRERGFERALAENEMKLDPSPVFYIRELDFNDMIDSLLKSGADGIFALTTSLPLL